ncbi:MAG: hypothetical protein KFH98_07105 [Gemmatimonadetes bacterium]|nr:hypothetical protein [Gemmatimonadota bacterium]
MGLASRGLRDMDTGPERIGDATMLDAVRRQAARVHLLSLIATALLTGVYLLLS